jgi:hypothetical protein
MSINWTEIMAVAETISGIAVAASLLLVVLQLQGDTAERFVTGSASLFQIWEDDDFQRAVQWVLYELRETTWREFVAKHRNQYGERAFIRVGAYYNRVGYLITHRLVGGFEGLLLDIISPQAIAVWRKIQPIVLEARLTENSMLFQDFERVLPQCFECYIPSDPADLIGPTPDRRRRP